MPSFSPIRDIPQQGTTEWQYAVLSAMKENVEVLTGQRGTAHAITTDAISAVLVQPAYQQMLAGGIIGGAGPFADGQDYGKLVQTVYNLAYDVQQLRSTVQTLLNQIKA